MVIHYIKNCLQFPLLLLLTFLQTHNTKFSMICFLFGLLSNIKTISFNDTVKMLIFKSIFIFIALCLQVHSITHKHLPQKSKCYAYLQSCDLWLGGRGMRFIYLRSATKLNFTFSFVKIVNLYKHPICILKNVCFYKVL